MPEFDLSHDSTQMMPNPAATIAPRKAAVKVVAEDQSSGMTAETNCLLVVRLRNAAMILALGSGLFSILQLLTPSEQQGLWTSASMWGRFVVALLLSVLAWRLFVQCPRTLSHLRITEFFIFGSLAALFAINIIAGQMQVARLGFLLSSNGPWLILIFIYSMYIPNTWQRAARVLGAFTVLALISFWLPALFDARTQEVLNQQPMFKSVLVQESFAVVFCAGIATWGVRMIGLLRKQVYEAQQIGQYKLVKLLGRGGMGEVHLAEHLLLRRPCAIKLIVPEKAGDPHALARFEREVQSTARLSHWNTVEIFDYGRTEDGVFYYVMEYLPGLNLQQITEMNGPLPPERVIHLLMQACDALQEAHDHGMVHRDIKPANIFAASRGGVYDVVKLLDFGLVRDRSSTDAKLDVTQEGIVTGSPLFMSPEQAMGEVPDARSDLYSLGIVGYFLLTGHVPFESDKAVKVLIAHAQQSPPPMSAHGVSVPMDLERIIMQCLEKSPDARPQSALELHRALRKCDLANLWNREKAAHWWKSSGCPHKKALDAEVLGFA